MSVSSASANGNCVDSNMSPWLGVAKRSLNEPRAAPAICTQTASKTLPIALVGIEAVVQELTEETPGLRVAEDVRRAPANRKVGSVAECRCRITKRGKPNTCDDWAGRAIRHTVPAARVESAIQLQTGARRSNPSRTASVRAEMIDRLVPEEIADGRARSVGLATSAGGYRTGGRKGSSMRNVSVVRSLHDDVDVDRIDRRIR